MAVGFINTVVQTVYLLSYYSTNTAQFLMQQEITVLQRMTFINFMVKYNQPITF
jgi:hypothetical protein